MVGFIVYYIRKTPHDGGALKWLQHSALNSRSQFIDIERGFFTSCHHQLPFQGNIDGLLTHEVHGVLGAQAGQRYQQLDRSAINQILAIQDHLRFNGWLEIAF